MMIEINSELLGAINEIRDLLRVIAEPAIAERDKKLRVELRRVVGVSGPKGRAVVLMDGTQPQTAIHKSSGLDKSNLSKFVKQLVASNLLVGDGKQPKIVISIPPNFFEGDID